MKKRFTYKFIITILIVLFGATMISGLVFASSTDNFDLDGFDGNAADTIVTPVEETIGTVIETVRIVFLGIAIIMLTVIGVKYMIASPGERADLKKSSVQYAIGAVVLLGASGILGILIDVFSKIGN